MMKLKSRWVKVVFADDCEPCEGCGEPWCKIHRDHFANCPCIGPTQDDVIYLERKGVLYASKIKSPIQGDASGGSRKVHAENPRQSGKGIRRGDKKRQKPSGAEASQKVKKRPPRQMPN